MILQVEYIKEFKGSRYEDDDEGIHHADAETENNETREMMQIATDPNGFNSGHQNLFHNMRINLEKFCLQGESTTCDRNLEKSTSSFLICKSFLGQPKSALSPDH